VKKGCYAGVDVGSAYTKVAVIDDGAKALAYSVQPTGLDMAGAGSKALAEACGEAGLEVEELKGLVSTGYGRDDVAESEWTRSEILCLAKGAFALMGCAMTVVDIGGQDSKIVFLDGQGARTDYRMNRKCAAGTGAFLEIIAMRLGVQLDELDKRARQTDECAPLGSFCSVFAATEVLDLLRHGYGLEAIARGVYRSVAQRVIDMGAKGPLLAMAGGVVEHHPVLVDIVREMTQCEVVELSHPQHVVALGAAVLAMERDSARTIET